MFKLTVVSGPNRGTTYVIHEGENSIGRQSGNEIVLPSGKISKRHCVLVVSNGEIVMTDAGSANGTFVNGQLVKSKPIQAGDKISVGEYVLEVSGPPPARVSAPPALQGIAPVLQFPQQMRRRRSYPSSAASAAVPAAPFPGADPLSLVQPQAPAAPAKPQSILERLRELIESRVMPSLYSLNLKTEWHMICAGVLGALVALCVAVAVYPLLDQNTQSIVRESGKRAKFMARQIVESNAAAIASHAESKTDIGPAESAENVRVAMLLDLDSRVIAPGSRSGQNLVSGIEARVARVAAKLFREGREAGFVKEAADEGVVVAVEPVKVVGPTGRNSIAAMALVSLDTDSSTLQAGDMSVVYFESLVYCALIAALAGYVVYRLTLKPFEVLSEDLDRALKGELGAVTHEYKLSELNGLWDLINAAIPRLSRGGESAVSEIVQNPDDFIKPVEALLQETEQGFLFLDADRKVLRLNAQFETLSGIREEMALGQEIGSVAREQSFSAFVEDLCSRTSASGETVTENYDFNGVPHRVKMVGLGRSGEPAKFRLLVTTRSE